MRHIKATLGVICATALLVAAGPAAGQNFNRTTKLTFSTPVELPTMTLPAGTYTFRLSDSTSDRHVVQVLDADGAKLVTMLHAMPARRLQVSEDTVVTFHETSATAPLPIRFWYFPDDKMGQEFAYPKDRALLIAQATGESVLAIDGDQITRVEPTPTPAPVEPAPVIAPDTPPARPMEPDTRPAGTTGLLPQTASELPLVGLIGLLALGGALLIGAFRRSITQWSER